MKEATKKKPRKNILLRLIVIAFGVYLLYSLIMTQSSINEKRAELEALKTAIEETRVENEVLQKTIDSYGTDEFVEEQARDKLGYAYSDEHFYVDVSGSN